MSSPTKGDIPPRLRHRSHCSESESIFECEVPVAESVFPMHVPTQAKTETPPLAPESGHRSRNTDAHLENKKSGLNTSVLKLLASELTRGYYLEGDESHYEERRERVYTFMQTPRELEKFCLFGYLQCLDAFLFIITFLPMRIVMGFLRLLTHPCMTLLHGSRRVLQPAQVCDMLKGVMVVISCAVISCVDTSMMYHIVRGQAVIKLYVFYNMLDLFDRLVSGFGQDILDALYWTATEPKVNRRREIKMGFLFHFVVAVLYIILHTFLILCQATVLNVAFNSHNKALLTIMMSNNFVEIKSSLFKHVDRNSLLYISCSDVKERFHYSILLLVVFVRNMTEFHWNPDYMWVILPDTLMVLGAEVLVDWVKHAFITKFNEISAECYRHFTVNLAQDMVTSRQKHAFTDYSDQVSRRLGFTPLPLLCLVYHVCSRSVQVTGLLGILLVFLFYLCLVTVKILTSIILLSWGCHLLEEDQQNDQQTDPTEVNSQVIAKKDSKGKEKPSPSKLSRHSSTNELSSHSLEGQAASVNIQEDFLLREKDGDQEEYEMWHLDSVQDTFTVQPSLIVHGQLPSALPQQQQELLLFGDVEVKGDQSGDSFASSVNNSVSDVNLTLPSKSATDIDEEKKHK